jgi:hypothetical protein
MNEQNTTGQPSSNAQLPYDYRDRRGRSPLTGSLFGLAAVIVGVLFLLQNLGVLYIGQLWRFWPLILIALGVTRLVEGSPLWCRTGRFRRAGRGWGVFMILLGGIFLAQNFGYLSRHIWRDIWPLFLIYWGINLIWMRSRGGRFGRGPWDGPGNGPQAPGSGPGFDGPGGRGGGPGGGPGGGFRPGQPGAPGVSSALVAVEASNPGANPGSAAFEGTARAQFGGASSDPNRPANRLREFAILGGVRRRVESQDFLGGEVTALMGGVELDLSGAGTKLDEVVIEANAIMGGVDMRVPAHWAVTVQGTGILGGYEDATRELVAPTGKRPHLIITGTALMGGVSVKN